VTAIGGTLERLLVAVRRRSRPTEFDPERSFGKPMSRMTAIDATSRYTIGAKMKPSQHFIDRLEGFVANGLVLALLLAVTTNPVLGQEASKQSNLTQDFRVKKLELPGVNGLVVLD
jgi:hypothetical protein